MEETNNITQIKCLSDKEYMKKLAKYMRPHEKQQS